MKKLSLLLSLATFAVALSAQSVVETQSFFSVALGETKSYRIYLPDGYDDDTTARYPVVYFLRLHESEWFNPALRPFGTTLKNVIDYLIDAGDIGKVIVVGPSTGGNNQNQTDAGIVNMLRPDLANDPGIGTGRFEDYFFQDLIPHIDSTYRTIAARCARGIDGFSLGGYASTLYAVKHPGVFASVGSYDGSIMWYRLDNPQTPGTFDDDGWVTNAATNALFSPMFDQPRDSNYMRLHSAIDILVNADPVTLDSIREIAFHIRSVATTSPGNYDRNQQLLDTMAAKGIDNSFSSLALSSTAVHNYVSADAHARESLVKHWQTFSALACDSVTQTQHPPTRRPAVELFQNFPNPFAAQTTISFFLPERTAVRLTVWNALGQYAGTLVDETLPSGTHRVRLEAAAYPQGFYFYRLEAAGGIFSRRFYCVGSGD